MVADPHAEVAAKVESYRNLVAGAAERHKVPITLLEAMIHQESGANPDAFRVECGVCDASFGLLQLLLTTVRGIGYLGPVRMLFDPAVNIEFGAQYLAGLLTKYKDPLLALVAYNGGPSAARWYRAGWRSGRAAHYAATVHALELYYDRREKARVPSG